MRVGRSVCASSAPSSTSSPGTVTSARRGILGGTFNPPHIGHLLCAAEAADQLGLDEVVLMPVAAPPHKEALRDPGAAVRLELCRLAARDVPGLEASSLEIERGGPSYTVDTLRALRDGDEASDLTFIVGGDMALSFHTWREPEAVLRLATLAVAERSGAARRDIEERLGGRDRVTFFDMPRMDVSSTEIRRRVAQGRSIRHLVPDCVGQHIGVHKLYT